MADTSKPDLTRGMPFHDLPDGGKILGTVGEDEVIVLRRGDALFACGAYCTHYHGALMDGLATDETLRCPLHHACFSIRTGEALRAPALDPIQCWRVERVGDTIFVREKRPPSPPASRSGHLPSNPPAHPVAHPPADRPSAQAPVHRHVGQRQASPDCAPSSSSAEVRQAWQRPRCCAGRATRVS